MVEQARSALGYQVDTLQSLEQRIEQQVRESEREAQRQQERKLLHQRAVEVSSLTPTLLDVGTTSLWNSPVVSLPSMKRRGVRLISRSRICGDEKRNCGRD